MIWHQQPFSLRELSFLKVASIASRSSHGRVPCPALPHPAWCSNTVDLSDSLCTAPHVLQYTVDLDNFHREFQRIKSSLADISGSPISSLIPSWCGSRAGSSELRHRTKHTHAAIKRVYFSSSPKGLRFYLSKTYFG